MYNILTINNKISTCCKTDLLTGQQFIDLLPAQASGNRSVLGSNKTAVVLEPSQ